MNKEEALKQHYHDLIVAKMQEEMTSDKVFNQNFNESIATNRSIIINKRGDIISQEYDPVNGMKPTGLENETIVFSDFKDYAVNTKEDNVTLEQLPDDAKANMLKGAALKLSRDIDTLAYSVLAEQGTRIDLESEDSIYEQIIKLSTELDMNEVPDGIGERKIVINNKYKNELLLDRNFILSSDTSQEMLKSGVWGTVHGLEVYVSAALPKDVKFAILHSEWAEQATDWVQPPIFVDLTGTVEFIKAVAVKARVRTGAIVTDKRAVMVGVLPEEV